MNYRTEVQPAAGAALLSEMYAQDFPQFPAQGGVFNRCTRQ